MDLIRVSRKKRGLPLISLAGYTNAGKSTLFNALTTEQVKVSSQLFTTLTPTTRLTRMDGKPVFLSDTVGFIKNLPTLLIEAFYATLREIALSDLILLVADVSEPLPKLKERVETSLQTLYSIGAHNVPIILVLNKIDLIGVEEAERKAEELDLEIPYVFTSAKYGWGLENLQKKVSSMLKTFIRVETKLPYNGETMSILSEICEFSKINGITFDNGFVKLDAEIPIQLAEKLRRCAADGVFKVE